jgi:polyferredoxin
MSYFIFFSIGLIMGCLVCGVLVPIFFMKKISEYKKDQIKSKRELERYKNDFTDKYIDDGYDAY